MSQFTWEQVDALHEAMALIATQRDDCRYPNGVAFYQKMLLLVHEATEEVMRTLPPDAERLRRYEYRDFMQRESYLPREGA